MTASLVHQDQRLVLSGVVTFANAAALYQQGVPLLNITPAPTVLDLSQLSQSNTIAVAVIVQWLRQLKPAQSLQLQHVPDKLQAIMRASNLERLLPAPANLTDIAQISKKGVMI